MSVVRVMELVGSSQAGWEEAVKEAVEEARRQVGQVHGVEVVNLTANVGSNGEITHYKADVHIAYSGSS